jgi:hypothetical protein
LKEVVGAIAKGERIGGSSIGRRGGMVPDLVDSRKPEPDHFVKSDLNSL